MNGAREVQQEVLCDKVETVKRFCYSGDRLNASGIFEATVTARTRLEWKKFRVFVFERKQSSYFEKSRKIYGEAMCSVSLH